MGKAIANLPGGLTIWHCHRNKLDWSSTWHHQILDLQNCNEVNAEKILAETVLIGTLLGMKPRAVFLCICKMN